MLACVMCWKYSRTGNHGRDRLRGATSGWHGVSIDHPTHDLFISTHGIVGTGAMGRGIAQLAAQAGSQVLLFDNQPQASAKAHAESARSGTGCAKGRMDEAEATACKQRLACVDALEDLRVCDLVIEAIVERLDAEEEESVRGARGPSCVNGGAGNQHIIAVPVTAIAAGLQRPHRIAGLHFYEPSAT